MNIGIFGAGIAGLMSAIALRTQGHSCRIYERSREAQDAGMGFILLPEGIEYLRSFGMDLTGASSGVPLESYCCRDASGEILREEAMPAGARSIRRRDLTAAMMRALSVFDIVTFDAELDGLEVDAAGRVASARLSSGKHVEADLYIAADGTKSRARQIMFPDWPTDPARVQEVVGLAHSESAVRWCGNTFNKFHAPDGGLAVGVLPLNAEQLVWYLQFDSKRFSPPKERSESKRTFLQKLIGDWVDPLPHLLAMTDFSRVHTWRPVDTELIPRFHRQNLVLVGDAAHPLLPFTSRGVSSAMAGGIALGKFLSGERSLEEALSGYSSECRHQCLPYIAKGREMTQYFLAPQLAGNLMVPVA